MAKIPANKIIKEEENYDAEYVTWHNMKRRCYNPKSSNYKYYGAKGVTVCGEWLDSETGFRTFFYDMGRRPEGHSLDRIDPYGDYSKDNCRWADSYTQGWNKRTYDRTRPVTINGRTQTVREWSVESGIGIGRINARIRAGCSEDEILYVGNISAIRNRQRVGKTV